MGSTVVVRVFGRPQNHDRSRPIPSNATRSAAARPSYRWTPAIRFDRHPKHGGEPMSTALIVANQTLPSQALADAIAERIRRGVRS